MENLITFDNNNALKIKVITVTLNTNILIGDSINVDGIPNTTVFVTGFLYNYIKQEKRIFTNTGTYKFLIRTNV